MTRIRTKHSHRLDPSVTFGLVAALAVPALLVSTTAFAAGPEDPNEAPIIVVTAPEPAPPAPPAAPPGPDATVITVVHSAPAPDYAPAVPASHPPSTMIVDPQVASLRYKRNSGIGMTISGFTLFGTGYLISALVGTISLDLAADVGGTGTYGRRMLIPLVGPFMAIPRADSATGGLFTGLLGVVQLGGLALGTAGAIRFGRANRQLRLSANSGGLQLQF